MAQGLCRACQATTATHPAASTRLRASLTATGEARVSPALD